MIKKLIKRTYLVIILLMILFLPLSSFNDIVTIIPAFGENILKTTATITGLNSEDYFGWNVTGVGDVNGDGYDDILVGAPYVDGSIGSWWDLNWAYRKSLTFDNSAQAETLTNFPVLVTLNQTNFDFSKAKSDGSDLRFIDSDDSTPLNYHIEYWDPAGNSLVWVNVDNIDAGSQTDFMFMYYGNSQASDGRNIEGTYDGNFAGVWHLNETSGTHYDATSNNNDGTPVGGVTQNAVGIIDGGCEFDGAADYVNCGSGSSLDITSAITIEAWVKPLNINHPGTDLNVVHKYANNDRSYVIYFNDDSSDNDDWDFKLSTSGTSTNGQVHVSNSVDNDQWQYIVGSWNGTTMLLYKNGAVIGTPAAYTGPISVSATDLWIGDGTYYDSMEGSIDEVRISNIARSADWIAAQYLSMTSWFLSYGIEENNNQDRGAAYLFFGYSGINTNNINASLANVTIHGSFARDHFGWSLSQAGDVNGDGMEDLIIGAPGYDVNRGRAYIFHGRPGWNSVLDADSEADTIFTGENQGDRFGHSVSGVGDVDKDNYFDAWQFRKKITIMASEVTADLTNFPVVIQTIDPDLAKVARTDGLDIVFTQSDGKTLLDFELESYNETNGELIAWIRIPFLSSTVNTEIYMYYGNPTSQDHSNPEGVWDSSYVGVWHLPDDPSGTPPQFEDSTFDSNDGTSQGSLTAASQVNGKIDGSIDSKGVDEYINVSDSLSFDSIEYTGEFTLYSWIYPRDQAWYSIMGSDQIRFCKDDSLYVFLYNPASQSTWSASPVIIPNSWQQVAATYNRATQEVIIYHNGNQMGLNSVPNADLNSPNDFHISDSRGWVDYFDGIIDEVRVSNVARSSDWIATSFNNQNDTSSFYLIDSEELLPNNWFYRKQITIDSAKVAGDLTDFPVLINIVDLDLARNARSDGFDIVFTQSDGKTKLDHEIIKFDGLTGELMVWVKFPFLSSVSNTQIYMYYGNSESPDLQDTQGVWSNGYMGVWHLDETSGNVLDSTTYGLEATFPATASRGIDGQIGYAYQFFGSTGELDFGDPADGHLDFGLESFSFSLWVNSTEIDHYQDIIWKGARWSGSPGYVFYRRSIANGGTVCIAIGDNIARVQNDFSISDETWVYIVGVADRGTDLLHAYMDGIEQGTGIDTSSIGSVDSADEFEIADNSDPFNGAVDEVRVSRTARSSDWVSTEYNNQVDPGGFYSLESEEIVPQNWYFYKPITIHSSQVIADLSDFPVLIEITDTDLIEKARTDGSDIVFTGADGKTRFDHEIESYNRKTGDLVAWVRIPSLSSTSDTLIYMYYGNPEINDQQNAEAVWKNGYVGVYHMDEEIGSIINSASQINNGTRVNAPTRAKGHIGYGQEFTGLGADDLFNLGNLGLADGVNENLTMSFWANIDYTITESWGKIITKRNDLDNDYIYHVGFDAAADKRLGIVINTESSWSFAVDNNIWVYVVATYDGNFKKIYLNTTEILSDTQSSGPLTSSSADVSIGSRITTQNFGGLLDEVRLSGAVHSPVWIATEYNNQKYMSSFITLGSELGGGKQDDVIIGAPGYSNERGRAYVFVGGGSFSGVIPASEANSIITGNSMGDKLGHVVSGNGDINKADFDDIIISAPGANGNDGAVYIKYGTNPMPLLMDSIDSDVVISGSSGFELGYSLSRLNDLNDDGYDDVIVGSPKNSGDTGAAYVFFGSGLVNPLLTIMDADVTMYGEALGDKFGSSICRAKDMNGDGINDVAVGAPYFDDGANLDSGAIYIFEGGTLMDGTSDWTIKGENPDDHFGWTISHAGKITTDNLNYLIVGAPHNDDGGLNSGKTYLITATYKPVITNVLVSPPTQVMGGNINISCSVTAPSSIDSVWVNITLPDGGYLNQSLISGFGDSWFLNQSYLQTGVYQFVIWASNSFSDWSQSSISQFSMYNQVPSLSFEQVSPASGFIDSNFNFAVTYTDLDNQPPDTITVNITGFGTYDLIEYNPLDSDYSDGKDYYLDLSGLSVGQYSLHFAANDTTGFWAESTDLQFDVVNRAPTFSLSSVNPTSGSNDDNYNFSVTYTDLDDHVPGVISVNISGVGAFDLLELDPTDSDFTDGKIYYYDHSGFSIGQYQFNFAANDSLGEWVESGALQFDVGNRAPSLSSELVSPQTGYFGDYFNFTVTYIDSDNHAPSKITVNITNFGVFDLFEVDLLDNNYIDGKEYYFNSSFPPSSYSFHFAANDILGLWAPETPEIPDPVISPRPGILDVEDFTREFGDPVFLNATIEDNLGNPIAGENVSFYIDSNKNGIFEPGELVGTLLSSGSGEISYEYPVLIQRGIYNYTVIYTGSGDYVVSDDKALLTIEPKLATLTAAIDAVESGETAFLNATLLDTSGNPVISEQVALYLDKNRNGYYEPSEVIVTVTTTVDGLATINYYISLAPENYGFWAKYVGSENYVVTEIEGLITVQSTGNIPPTILGTVPNQIKYEDSLPWNLDLTPYEDDIEDFGLNLKWYLEGVNNSLYLVTGENSSDDVLTFIPYPDAFGSNEVTLWLVDSGGNWDTQTLWINLTPVNDIPYFDPLPPDLYVHYDDPNDPNDDPGPWDYTFYVHDIETSPDNLVLITSEPNSDSGDGYAEVHGLSVTFHYPQDRVGEAILVFLTLSDGTDSVQNMIVVNITSDWVPELSGSLPDIVITENSTRYNVFDLDDFFTDRDQDIIYFSSGNENIIVNINENHTVDITAPPQWSGDEFVTFRARDPTGAIVEDVILVTVLPVNDGPTIIGVPDLVVHYEYSYSFDLSPYIHDPDNLTSELTVSTSESTQYIYVQHNNNLGILINYPEALDGTTIPLTIYVSDGLEISSWKINVSVSPYFPPELVANLPDVYFNEDSALDKAFVLSNYFLDVDSNILFYTDGAENINITINSDLSVDFSAPENWFGYELVTFRATDPQGALAEDKIMVYVVPVNDAPTIEVIPKQEKQAGDQWVVDLTDFINDVDNDPTELVITVESDSHQGYVTIVGHVLIFQYPPGVNEDYVSITVSDGELETHTGFLVSIKDNQQIAPSIWDLIPWPWVFSTIFVSLVGAMVVYRKMTRYKVYEAFLIHEKGLSVGHASLIERSELEEVIVSGMFTAVQDFIGDTFSDKTSEDWELDEMKFGENKILIERSKKLFLAVVFEGNGNRLRIRVKRLLGDINHDYGEIFEGWSGDMSEVRGINPILMGIISKRRAKRKEPEKVPLKPESVMIEPEPLEINHEPVQIKVDPNLTELNEIINWSKELTKIENITGEVEIGYSKEDNDLNESLECPICGIEVNEGNVFCLNCKAKFSKPKE